MAFNRYTFPRYIRSDARSLACEYLDAVYAGLINRLMLFMPPQFGKSEIVARRFPAYGLGRNPSKHFILTSYASPLAVSLSKDARNIIRDDYYQRLFGKLSPSDPVELDPSTNSGEQWKINGHRGGMRATGIGGSISGHPADYMLIDDPVKNMQEAQSLAVQTHNYNEYHATLKTRLAPGAPVVLLQTRWDDEDLAGKLLKDQHAAGGDRWVVVRMPLVCEAPGERHQANEMMGIIEEPDVLGRNPKDDPLNRQPGEVLDPERFDEEESAKILAGPPRIVSAIWQQLPRPVEGNLIPREWFEIVDRVPPTSVRPVRVWDLASTEEMATSPDPDWTVGLRMWRWDMNEYFSVFYIDDIIRRRLSPLGVEKLIRQTAELDGRRCDIVIEQEPGASGKSYAQSLKRMLQGFYVTLMLAGGSKVQRARLWMPDAEGGAIKLVRGRYVEDFLRECDSFPHGHDDQIDCVSNGYRHLARKQQGRRARSRLPR
jgi:predicted phage terminase large subunit-like protein